MIISFGFLSGIGWLIDFCLFITLVWLKLPVWLVNMFSASAAVLFVFFTSVRNVFRYNGDYLVYKLIAYTIYQTISILTASFFIQEIITRFGIAPILSKVLITPLTFYANFQFMSFITSGKNRLI